MSGIAGLAYSADQKSRLHLDEICACLDLHWQTEHNIADFLLALEKNEFGIFLFDSQNVDKDTVKWVTFVRKLRPRVPLIVLSHRCEKAFCAKLLEQGVFYQCQHPVDREVLAEIFGSAIKQTQ